MKKLTKILAVFMAAVLLVVASVTATVAYLTLKDINPQENVFTVGDINITLEEEVAVDGVGTVTQTTTGADYVNIMPGDELTKRITVANPGNNPAYVALTVKVNNIDKIAAAIDDRYAAGEIQAIYDKVFTDWGLQYNATGMTPTNVMPTDAKLLQVDAAKVDASGAPNYDVDNWFADYAANMGNNEWEFTYYLYLAPGETFVPFEGLVAPAEFDREQLAMFEGLEINAVANAIQADNTLSAKSAFAALFDRLTANTAEVTSAAELQEALDNAVIGSTIILQPADYGTFPITQNLNGVTIDAAEAQNIRLEIKAGAVLENVTIANWDQDHIVDSGSYYDGGHINIKAGAEVKNLTIADATFNGAGGRSSAITCSEPTAEITMVNCVIDGPKYAVYASTPVAQLTLQGCKLNNLSSWAILLNGSDTIGAQLTIDGCTFVNCNDGIAKYLGNTQPEGAKTVFTNNTLSGCAGHDGSDAKWFAIPGAADTITVAGNTLDGAAWEPGTAQGLGK